jgi:hypothetical protein
MTGALALLARSILPEQAGSVQIRSEQTGTVVTL